MRIKWLLKALQNLDTEAEYIAKDEPLAAQAVVQRIQQTILLLEENPALGRPGRLPGSRELVIPETRYIVPYRVLAPACNVSRFCVYFTPPANNLNAGSLSFEWEN